MKSHFLDDRVWSRQDNFINLPIVHNLQSSSDIHTYIAPTLSVVVGAIIAFLFTRYISGKQARSDVSKSIIEDLSNIEALSAKYWLGDHGSEKEDPRDLDRIGWELQVKIDVMADKAVVINQLLPKEVLIQYREIEIKLIEVATGGAFMTHDMKDDHLTYAEVVLHCRALRDILQHQFLFKPLWRQITFFSI